MTGGPRRGPKKNCISLPGEGADVPFIPQCFAPDKEGRVATKASNVRRGRAMILNSGQAPEACERQGEEISARGMTGTADAKVQVRLPCVPRTETHHKGEWTCSQKQK